MRILFLAPRLPYPADTGGKIRTLNILKQIAKFASVHLVCFSFDEKDKEYAEKFTEQAIAVTLVPMGETGTLEKVRDVLFSSVPHSIAKYDAPKMALVLNKLCQPQAFDAVHVDHLHMAHYRACFKNLPSVLDEHNVEYKILERCVAVERSPVKKLIFINQASKMKAFEQKKVREFTAYGAVSEDDRRILSELAGAEIAGHVVPNGVDTEYFDGHPGGQEESLVFTGSMDWLPNEDAVLFFCREVLPLIWKFKPRVKFYVVGKGPTTAIEDLGKVDARIVVTGRVDDVRPLMAKSPVFVVPIRVGGGTRLKILEAMSMQKAVVSTTVGAEGIKYTKGKDIEIADTPQEFCDKTIALLNDHKAAAQIGTAARELVCGFYDWNIVGRKLKSIYEEITRHG